MSDSTSARTGGAEWSPLTVAPNETSAALIIGTLADAQIEARAVPVESSQRLPGTSTLGPVQVLVRRGEVDQARAALEAQQVAAGQVDWSEAGDPQQQTESEAIAQARRRSALARLPWPARIGFVLAVLALAVMIIGAVVMVLGLIIP